MPWRYNDEDALKAKLRSSGLTVGYYNCDGNVSFEEVHSIITFAELKGSPTPPGAAWD